VSGNMTREYREIELDQVKDAWWTVKREFEDSGYGELLASVRANGVLVPVLVADAGEGYYLVAGSRRVRAARECGLVRVPAVILGGGDTDYAWASITENVIRAELNPLDLARALRLVLDTVGVSQEALAARLGKSASWVTQRLGVLSWPPDVKEALGAGRIEFSVGRELSGIQDGSERSTCLAQAISSGCTARQAAEWKRQAEERRAPELPHPSPVKDTLASHFPVIAGAVCLLCRGQSGSASVRAFPMCDACIGALAQSIAETETAVDGETGAGS
jgi:ParB family chromosome partitioning protein